MTKQVKKPAQQTPVKISNIKLLPSGLASEPNKKMLDSTLDLMTSKGQMLPFKETFGVRTASNKVEEFFKVETDQVRRESQGNNMLVLRDSDDNYLGKVSYYDIENYFKVKGHQLKDGVVLDKNVNVLDLPVDPVKLTDYNLYYWLEDDLPLCRIHLDSEKFSITNDLLGNPFASVVDDITGNILELQNGMTVCFTGAFPAIDNDYITETDVQKYMVQDPIVFYVHGVGKNISLFPKLNLRLTVPFSGLEKLPWDKYGSALDFPSNSWEGSPWDSSEITRATAEYIVQEKYTGNTNHWQVSDRWYHIGTIRAVAKFLEVNVDNIATAKNRATRPIISFDKDVKLFNWPTATITEIKSILPSTPAYWASKTNFVDQFDYALRNGDKVVFEETDGIWQVDNVSVAATFTRHSSVQEGEGAIIVAPAKSEYYQVVFKNGKWKLAQNKLALNQTPLFEFYNSQAVSLETFNDTDFAGGIILGFESGSVFDTVLQKNVNVNAVVSESGVAQVTPNQLNFVTDVDATFEYTDLQTGEQLSINGPYGYKSDSNIISFYKNRTGLDVTKQIQDLLYTQTGSSEWSASVIPLANGFTTIHIYYDDVDHFKFYFEVEGRGLIRFTGKTGTDVTEQLIPLIAGDTMKIVCHDLPYPITFYASAIVNNITRLQSLSSAYISNNGITNGTIELDLNSSVDVDGVFVDNQLAIEGTKLVWEFNGVYKTAYVKSLHNWNFLQSAFTKDYTNQLFSNYDYTLTDEVLQDGKLDYYKHLTLSEEIRNKVQLDDKICISSVINYTESKTAPVSLTVNPLNKELTVLNYYGLYQHASVIKSNAADVEKFISTDSMTNFIGGGTILKHSDPLTKAAIVATNLPYDLGDLLIKQGKHYDIFLHKFRTELDRVIDTTDYNQYTSLEILDLVLNRIHVASQSDDMFWSHSNMLGWNLTGDSYSETQLTLTSQLLVNLSNNGFDPISHRAGKESILHVEYQGQVLLRGSDYWLLSQGGSYTDIKFRDFYNGKVINIKQWNTLFRSMVPASLAKIGLVPVYQPAIILDTVTGNYVLQRHDGSEYYLQDGIDTDGNPVNLTEYYSYEYEKAVWSSIAYDVEHNSQLEILENQPGYFRPTVDTWDSSRRTVNNEVRQWMLENNIFTMSNDSYDAGNGFTFKYQLGTGDDDSTVSGSWKVIYQYLYDTERPHSHPWEMMGYTVKPIWWDTHYSWTNLPKRTALKKALRLGKISDPAGQHIVNPKFSRNIDIDNNDPDSLEDFPVDPAGRLISPAAFNNLLLADSIFLGIDVVDAEWSAGDQGPYEQVFLNTHRGLAAQARACFLSAPAQYVNLNWFPGQTVKNQWGHKIDRSTGFWQQGAIAHNYHRETVNGELNWTSGIESLYSEFCVLNNKDYAAEVINKFANISVNKEFLLGGFTNKDNLRIQSTSTVAQKDILFVPDDNYQVRLVKHYPEREIFYSGIRIIFDGANYSLNGFATEFGYFPYYTAKPGSATTAVTVGNTVIKQKNNYSSEVNFVQYGKLFSNRQEIYDILIGYGKYLESIGVVYQEPEGGDIRNWQLSAKQFIFWSNDLLASGNYIDLNPCADFIKVKGQFGQLENLQGTNENIGQCVDRFNNPVFSKDLLVSRDDDTVVVKTKKTGSGIYGIKLVFVNYESVVHLDSRSIFGDVYFDSSQNTSKRSFVLGGKKSINWTGSYYIPGYVFNGTDLVPNFDSMAETGRALLDIESTVLDPAMLDASRAQFGLNRNPELRQLFLDSGNEVLFKNAITFNKGTTKVFDSLNPLTHQDGSKTTAYDEYMVRLGEFGNTKNIEFYEFEMLSSDIVLNSQLVKFSKKTTADVDNVLHIAGDSTRWVYRPYGKSLNFVEDQSRSKLKKSGPIINGDTDLTVDTLENLEELYNEFIDLWSIPAYSDKVNYKINQQVRYNGQLYTSLDTITAAAWTTNRDKFMLVASEPYLPNIFVKNYNKPNASTQPPSGFTPGTWQVLQTIDTNLSVVEICTGLTDVSKARVSSGTVNHNLSVGDYVCIVNANTNSSDANGIWKVVQIEQLVSAGITTYHFYINTRITETIYTGKVFALLPVRFKNQEDFNATRRTISVDPNNVTWNITPTSSTIVSSSTTAPSTPPNRYNWQQKYQTEQSFTPSGYDPRYPIAIVDDGRNDVDPVTFNYGNYKVYQYKDAIWTEVKVEADTLKIDDIEHLIVYDYASNKTLAKLELFSPQDLVIPSVFKDDIDVISRVDPAKYNRTTDKFKSIYTSLGWYEEYIGRRWWNTSTTQFNDYSTASDQVKAEYWGTTNNNALPEVYEWTKSTVHPSKWEKLVAGKTSVFGQVATGQVYTDRTLGSDNFYWVEETDYVDGKTYTVYYFWVKNKKTIAQESKFARTYTVEQLSKVLLNPAAAGLAWWSPVGVDAILINGIKPYLNNSSTVIQIKKKTQGAEKHQQWTFISDGNAVKKIPEWLHTRLRDSISGSIFYKKTITIDSRSDQIYIEKSIPDPVNLHRYNRTGNAIRPYAQSWFDDLYEARRTFITRLNELMLHVDITAIADWDTGTLKNKTYTVGDQTVDMTTCWIAADYRSEDYDINRAIVAVISDISSLNDDSFEVGDYVRVNNTANAKKYTVLKKTATGGFTTVFAKGNAIQFAPELDIYGWDSLKWDTPIATWDFNNGPIYYGIIDAIRNEIFVSKYAKYYPSIMCSMFRYILSEQINVDWLAKSSTIEPVNLIAQTLTNRDYVKRDEIGVLTDFYSSVKSYRDKIRASTINKITLDTISVTIGENSTTADITDAEYTSIGQTAMQFPVKLSISVSEVSNELDAEHVAIGHTDMQFPLTLSTSKYLFLP